MIPMIQSDLKCNGCSCKDPSLDERKLLDVEVGTTSGKFE